MSRKGLSLVVDEGRYFHSEENKIELVHCPNDKKECVKQLPIVNRYFQESHQARMDKDYLKAIEALQHAFDITYDIEEDSCAACSRFFQSTIISSMEIIYSDLKDLTSGWFSNKGYKPARVKATQVLEEMNQKMRGK